MKLAPMPQPRKIAAEDLPEPKRSEELPDETLTLRAAEKIFEAAKLLAPRMKVDYRTAVRRMVGNTEWRHDPERLAAAEARRARKRKRIADRESAV